MVHFNRSADVPYSPEKMYRLVNAIEDYPQFLPWCSHATVVEQTETMMIATIEVAAAGMHKSFTTKNILTAPNRIEMQHIDGPFKTLTGIWQFHELPDYGCRVELEMEFEVHAGIKSAIFSMFFHVAADRLVQAFIDRAKVVYEEQYGRS